MFFKVGMAFILYNLFKVTRTQSVDLTLVPDASGEDVVDASIAKLEALNVFPNDFGLLKRIALVETNFGTDIANELGGIWQITSDISSQLSDPAALLSLSQYFIPASIAFGTNITDLSGDPDFRIPLTSAFAARLYVQLLAGTSVPGPLDQQANWWNTYYNLTGNAQDFQERVIAHENATGCIVSKLDIWLLVDGSGSIGSHNFQTTLQFVANLSSEFSIAPDAVRFGFSVYSSRHCFISYFNQHTNNTAFKNAVLATTYPGGGTRTGNAINEVVQTGFHEMFGLRPLSAGVPRALVVLTDGQSGDDVLSPSKTARVAGITVFAVGIGSGINHNELEEIAGVPSRIFELDDFSQLITVLRGELSNDACTASAEIPDNTTVEVIVPPENTYYSSVQLPNNGSVELEFHVTPDSGSGVVYISGTIQNPSSAVHDFSAVITPGTTVITINSDDLNSSLNLAGFFSRSRRAVDNESGSKPLYVALSSTSDQPLQVGFQSTGSPVRAAVVTASMNASSNATETMSMETVTMSNENVTTSTETTAMSTEVTTNLATTMSETLSTTTSAASPCMFYHLYLLVALTITTLLSL